MIYEKKEDFMKALEKLVGDRKDDDILEIIENFSETYDRPGVDELNEKIRKMEADYAALDDDWRRRYRERFFSGAETTSQEVKEEQEDDVKRDGGPQTYEELFKEREG